MLDVHAPEHGISGARDFFMHLFTITVGLFIALMLEAGVEALHHRHQREEAETLIRREIAENKHKLQEGVPGLVSEMQHVAHVVQVLEARIADQPGTLTQEDLGFEEGPMQDAAWLTASSTGALNYMDYEQVERFAEAYKQQALLQTTEEQALDDYLELMPILSHQGGTVSPEHARDALPYARKVLAHLNGMMAVGRGTLQSYESALK